MRLASPSPRVRIFSGLAVGRGWLRVAGAPGARGALRVGAGNRLNAFGLAFAEDANLLGLGRRQRLNAGSLLARALVLRLTLVGLDADGQLGLGDERLLF